MCGVLGVPRATYYWMLRHPEPEPEEDPIADDVDGAESVGCLPAGGEDFVAPALQEPLGSGDCLLVQIAHNVTS